MICPQGRYDECASHKKLVELALKDPLVRFAVEQYGARVVAVYSSTAAGDLHTPCVQDSEGGKESRVPKKQ